VLWYFVTGVLSFVAGVAALFVALLRHPTPEDFHPSRHINEAEDVVLTVSRGGSSNQFVVLEISAPNENNIRPVRIPMTDDLAVQFVSNIVKFLSA
jgi:hypothetical protein